LVQYEEIPYPSRESWTRGRELNAGLPNENQDSYFELAADCMLLIQIGTPTSTPLWVFMACSRVNFTLPYA
jgi:hypothetical protein